MRKLIILLAVIAPLFSFAQFSVNMVLQVSSSYKALKIHNTQMVALSSDALTLDIYDISTQMQPQLITSQTLTAPASNIELMDDYLLVTEAQQLAVYSLSAPNMPLISTFPITGTIKSLSVSQHFAFVTLQAADSNYALWYINLANPANPVLKSYITFYNRISEMTVDGVNGFLAEHQASQTLIYVFDLTLINLHVRNMKYLPVSTDFSAKGNNVYVYDNEYLSIYNWMANGQLSFVNKVSMEDVLNITALSNAKCIALKANELTVYEVNGGEVYDKTFSMPNGANSIISNNEYVFCATATQFYVLEVHATQSANIAPTLTSLNIYPNPAKESWKIDANTLERGDYRFELHNMLGQTVYTETFIGGNVWQIENVFGAGTYFYTIEKEGVILANGKMIGL